MMRLNQSMGRASSMINKHLMVKKIIDCISDDILPENEKKDIVRLPKTSLGKFNAVVYVDYLTKWPKICATSKQSTYTITNILVQKIVSRHCEHHIYYLITKGHSCQNYYMRMEHC